MSFLSRLSQWLLATLEPWGAPGLMLIAICDSSFLSLPEVNDAALMMLSINNPSRMWLLATMTVIGSIIGCLILYSVGRKGGEAMLRRRFAADKIARVRGWYEKYGMLAVIVPSLLPPPLPFKIFVLSAGAFRLSWTRFILAVGIGRSIRYFSEGILAVWYGQQAIKIVSDNFPMFGMILATLIVVGALFYVYSRRRKVGASLVLLPLLITVLGSGCVRTSNVPLSQRMLKTHPLTREQALQRVEVMSRAIQSLRASIELQGSTASLKEQYKRSTSPTLGGALMIQRPNRIFIKGTYTPLTIFEMVSDGTKYQFYSNQTKELYVDGMEDGPPYKRFVHLGDLANQFVNLRPRQIGDALVLDVLPLLNNSSIGVSVYRFPMAEDRKEYLWLDFVDQSTPKAPQLLQRIWFDLSTEYTDVYRRQTWTRSGLLDTDTKYFNYEPTAAGIRFPSKVEIQFVATETLIKIDLHPNEAQFNAGLPPETFEFDPHPDAKTIYKFEPAAVENITQQR
jgi:membrane protein YqaA with SNARE-associated domain/outer membrane lipoprotein-sorting protein